MEYSGSLAPRFVTAAVTYSTAHAHQEVLAWSRVFCVLYAYVTPPIKLREWPLHHGCVCWVSHERREYSVNTALAAVSARREAVCSYVVLLWLLLWLLCQPEENKHVCRSHGVSRLLPAFQPLSSCLAYPGFSEQCPQYEQQDNWHCEQDEEQNTGKEEDGPFCPQKGLKKWYGHVKNTEAMLKRIHWPNKRQFKYQNN